MSKNLLYYELLLNDLNIDSDANFMNIGEREPKNCENNRKKERAPEKPEI